MLRRSHQSLLITVSLVSFPVIALFLHNRRELAYELLFYLPHMNFAVATFLGLKLNQRKIFFTSLLFSIAYGCLQAPWLPPDTLARLLSVALPLSLFGIFFAPEERLRGYPGAFSAALTVIPASLLAFATLHANALTIFALYWKGKVGMGLVPLPDLGLLLAVGFAGFAFTRRETGLRTFRTFVAVSLIPLYFTLARFSQNMGNALFLEAAVGFFSVGALLIYGVFCLYWERVFIDDLTGIPNRRALNDRLAILDGDFAIAMVDIDFFKAFNDCFGHAEGDNVLRLVAKSLERDTAGRTFRYGGEEFAVVFEGATTTEAKRVMESVRRRLADSKFFIRAGKTIRERTSEKDRNPVASGNARTTRVTISVGIAGCTPHTRRPEDVMGNADRALYHAKALGRNRVVVDKERPAPAAAAGAEGSIFQSLFAKRPS